MDMQAKLLRSGGFEALARELGIPPATAVAGSEALLPAILGGLHRQSEALGGGAVGLLGMLEGLGGGALAAEVMGSNAADTARGDAVLAWIFSSKAVSRAVARQASATSNLEPELLMRMLPLLAMLAGGYLWARARGSGKTATSEGLDEVARLIAEANEDNPLDTILGIAGGEPQP